MWGEGSVNQCWLRMTLRKAPTEEVRIAWWKKKNLDSCAPQQQQQEKNLVTDTKESFLVRRKRLKIFLPFLLLSFAFLDAFLLPFPIVVRSSSSEASFGALKPFFMGWG